MRRNRRLLYISSSKSKIQLFLSFVFRFQNSITFFLGQRIQKKHFLKKFFPKLTPGSEYLNWEVKASAKVLSCLLSCVDVVDQAGPAAALIQNKCSLPIFTIEQLFVEHSFGFPAACEKMYKLSYSCDKRACENFHLVSLC